MDKLFFYLIVVTTNIIQTVSGFAGTMLAMPVSISLIGFDQARFILNFLGLLVSIIVLIKEKKHVNFKSIIEVIIFMVIGIVVSKLLVNYISRNILFFTYGIVIILFSIYQLSGKKIALNHVFSIMLLILAGIIHGLFVSGGALLVIYAMGKYKDKNEFRANMSLIWVILNSILLLSFIYEGNFTTDYKMLGLSIFFTLIGVWSGGKLIDKINQKRFEFITKCLLLTMGIIIIFS